SLPAYRSGIFRHHNQIDMIYWGGLYKLMGDQLHEKKSNDFFVVLLLAILAACSDSDDTTSNNLDEVDVEEKNSEATESKEEEADEDNEEMDDASEEKNEGENKGQEEIPDISEYAMNHAYDIINDYDMVKDSHIEVSKEDKKITLVIIVNAATNEEHAKELGDNFTRALASGVSIYSEDDLESPSKDNLGEIYDLHVGIGTSPDNFIDQAAMVTSASKITW